MLKIILLGLVCLALVGFLLFLFGPRESADLARVSLHLDIPDDMEAYLQEREAQIPDIRSGQAKQIVWADPQKRDKRPFSLVYIHGFTASLGEIRPLPDLVAKALDANLFYTRLQGHARKGPNAMGQAEVENWLKDVIEAIEIGSRLGEKLILVSTSTGGTLVAWALAQPEVSGKVAASVFVSPNFGINDRAAFLLDWPFARYFVPWLAGERLGRKGNNELQNTYWTNDYPSIALLPMAAAVRLAKEQDFSSVETPAYFAYSPKDKVVLSSETDAIFQAWGGSKERWLIDQSGDTHFHVNFGLAQSPGSSPAFAEKLNAWIKEQ